MARVNCDRCIKPTKATSTQEFSVSGVEYKLELCDPHADAFLRDMLAWIRLAAEVEREQQVAPDRWTIGRAAQLPRPQVERTRYNVTHIPPDPKQVPKTALEWTLTRHAEEQLEERGPQYGITKLDVFRTCVEPSHTYESVAVPGRFRYVRGDCSLVVNPATKKVVTVMPNAQEWGNEIEHTREPALT